jgi:hypothetical protein
MAGGAPGAGKFGKDVFVALAAVAWAASHASTSHGPQHKSA